MNRIWNSSQSNEQIDIHCHILPDIDDGAGSIEESVEMLKSASENGINGIVATPHVRSKSFDFGYAEEQFNELKRYADNMGINLYQGFEVNCEALIDFEFKNLDKMSFIGADSFLLEFRDFALPPNWQLVIRKLQSEGLKVIIAHPERYDFIQRDVDLARRMTDMGCTLQCDAYPFELNRFDRQRKTAYKLLDGELVSWIASDAHSPGNYLGYRNIINELNKDLVNDKIEFGGNFQ